MTRPTSDQPEKVPPVTIEGESFASPPRRIEYPQIDIPGSGELAKVAPGIFWLRIPMPMDLNHINLWLLEDGDGWTLVDSGLNADLCREAWEALEQKAFNDRPLKRIFLTHLHPDHVGLSRWLQERHGAEIWMSEQGLALTRVFASVPTEEEIAEGERHMRNHGYLDEALTHRFVSGKMYRSAISGIPEISRMPLDGDTIEIGSRRWRVYETNGHAEGHQCLYDAEGDVLISGDQVLPTISSNVSYSPRGKDTNPLASYMASLDRLGKLDRRTLVLPSHGRPFFGLNYRTADLIAHHREHLETMWNACSEPSTAFDLVPALFKRRLVGSHWMFAMGETIAHAEYLVRSGKLERQIAKDGTIRYRRAGDQ